jgi:peptide/nickel transport system substrate-binding protein
MLIGIALSLVLLGAACGKSSNNASSDGTTPGQNGAVTDEGTPVDGGTLVIGISAETNGWNPIYSQWADTGSLVASSVFEPLATVGPDLSPQPWLATSWTPNATFDSWTINLREGVTYQNGEAFDAASVKQNLDGYINGALSGLALGPMFKDIKVVDPKTVQVDLKQPWAAFPSSFLQGGSSWMMAPAMFASPDHGSAHPIGTGAFTFDSWSPDATFKAKKNPSYWQKGLPHLDSIEFRVIPDDTARNGALQSGDVNMIYTTNANAATSLGNDYHVIKDWDTEASFVMTNTAEKVGGKANPLANQHARNALAYATDPTTVASIIGSGVQVPTGPWSPTNPWGLPKDQNGALGFDLEKAKQEVALYKQDTGASDLTVSLAGLPNIDDQRVLQLVTSQWSEAGIKGTIESLEQTAYIGKIATGDFQAAFFRNYGYTDPDQDFYFWSSTTAKGVGNISINFTQYTSPAMEADLDAGRRNPDVNARKDAYHDLVKQLNTSATNIWLYNTPYTFIADRNVRGLNALTETPFGNYSPKTWLNQLWRAPS